MPTVVQLENALRAWVLSAMDDAYPDEQIIIADQGQPRPERPYGDIRIDAIESRGRDEQRPVDDYGDRDVVGVRAVRVTVQFYGPGAVQLAERARSALYLETVTDVLSAAGVAFWSAMPVLNLPIEIETEIEPRAAFDVVFGVASVQSEDVGLIETVEGTGTFSDVDGSPIPEATVDYEVPVP